MHKKSLPIYQLLLMDDDSVGIALVDNPAIESDFMYFTSQETKLVFNDEKMIVRGAALIPDKLIYRNDKLGERYVYLSKETILQFVESFMKKSTNKFNLGHTDNYTELNLIESYFAKVDNEFGVPEGSWIISAKVKDPAVWEQIKNKTYNGFSIESLFVNELVQTNFKSEMKTDLLEKLQNAIKTVLFNDEIKLADVPVVDEPSIDAPVVDNTQKELEAMLAEFHAAIMEQVDAKLKALKDELSGSVAEVDKKVEQFGNQAVVVIKETEAVTTPVQTASKASQYFQK